MKMRLQKGLNRVTHKYRNGGVLIHGLMKETCRECVTFVSVTPIRQVTLSKFRWTQTKVIAINDGIQLYVSGI